MKWFFSPSVIFVSARPRFKQHNRHAYVPLKSGGIALINGACHLDQGHSNILEKCEAPTNMQPCLQAGSTSHFFSDTVKRVYIVRARVALQALKPVSLRALGRFTYGPGCADGA
jgi:hypothetical protein